PELLAARLLRHVQGRAAKSRLAFEENHLVAPLGRHARGLHAARPAADDDDTAPNGGLVHSAPLALPAGDRVVDAASLFAELDPIDAAGARADAPADVVTASLRGLVDPLRIRERGAHDRHEVACAALQQ